MNLKNWWVDYIAVSLFMFILLGIGFIIGMQL